MNEPLPPVVVPVMVGCVVEAKAPMKLTTYQNGPPHTDTFAGPPTVESVDKAVSTVRADAPNGIATVVAPLKVNVKLVGALPIPVTITVCCVPATLLPLNA